MADKLIIVLMNSDPTNPSELGAPFFQASVAAAMDYEVELLFTGRAGELAKKGIAERIQVREGSNRTVYDYIQEAHEAGVRMKICTPTLEIWGDDIIPEIEETVGGAYLISEAMDDGTVVFTY